VGVPLLRKVSFRILRLIVVAAITAFLGALVCIASAHNPVLSTAALSSSSNSHAKQADTKRTRNVPRKAAEQPVAHIARVSRRMQGSSSPEGVTPGTFDPRSQHATGAAVITHPHEEQMHRAQPFDGDLRTLPQTTPEKRERPEREPPPVVPVPLATPTTTAATTNVAAVPSSDVGGVQTQALSAPAPAPVASFD